MARNYHAIWWRPLITSPFHQRAARPRLGRGHERLRRRARGVRTVGRPRAEEDVSTYNRVTLSALLDGRGRFPEGNQFQTVTSGVMTDINVRGPLLGTAEVRVCRQAEVNRRAIQETGLNYSAVSDGPFHTGFDLH